MAKFSIADGVFETMHKLINPGQLPPGFRDEAMHHAKKTHKLPLPPNIEGEEDYKIILNDIRKFVCEESHEIPLVFVNIRFDSSEYQAAVLAVRKIFKEAGEPEMKFQLCPVDVLFLALQRKVIDTRNTSRGTNEAPIESILLAAHFLEIEEFPAAYLNCDFHENEVEEYTLHCSLAQVRRWCFVISSYCCDEAVTIPGRHYPKEYNISPATSSVNSEEKKSDGSFRQTPDEDVTRSQIKEENHEAAAAKDDEMPPTPSDKVIVIGRLLLRISNDRMLYQFQSALRMKAMKAPTPRTVHQADNCGV